MREWSAELAVDGVVKCGYPGVVVVQGEARACDEFVRRLRGLGWSAPSGSLLIDDDDRRPPCLSYHFHLFAKQLST